MLFKHKHEITRHRARCSNVLLPAQLQLPGKDMFTEISDASTALHVCTLPLSPPPTPMGTPRASIFGASELTQEQLPNKPTFNIIFKKKKKRLQISRQGPWASLATLELPLSRSEPMKSQHLSGPLASGNQNPHTSQARTSAPQIPRTTFSLNINCWRLERT